MTSSCKVIRLPGCESGPVEVWTTRPGLDEAGEDSFCALDSLWRQPGEEEVTETLARLEREVEETRKKCDAMIAEAEARVAEITEKARREGREAGLAEGRAAAQEELKERLSRLDGLLRAVERERKELYGGYRDDIIALVKAMVDKVLFHEVTTNPKVIEACLQTALTYVVENSKVRVLLHPDDMARLKEIMLSSPDFLQGAELVELVENPSIEAGGCRLESAFGEIDATVETRRRRLFAAIDAVFAKAGAMGGEERLAAGPAASGEGEAS